MSNKNLAAQLAQLKAENTRLKAENQQLLDAQDKVVYQLTEADIQNVGEEWGLTQDQIDNAIDYAHSDHLEVDYYEDYMTPLFAAAEY